MRKSVSAFFVYLNVVLFPEKSRKQKSAMLSLTEAEYVTIYYFWSGNRDTLHFRESTVNWKQIYYPIRVKVDIFGVGQ